MGEKSVCAGSDQVKLLNQKTYRGLRTVKKYLNSYAGNKGSGTKFWRVTERAGRRQV